MATNALTAPARDPDDREPGTPRAPSAAPQASFFAIYKKGQGYWTRMLSAGGAVLVLCLLAQFIYAHALATLGNRDLRLGISLGILAVGALACWFAMNRTTSVDFLIATDSEMKKVNWTSREELIGSTKVVVLFMFLIAFFLFGIDIFFGYFFYFIDVLKSKPL
ncbi:MAG TPA: preprotein translocase subunit SecE [Tepidisphaeraceae bacterium]|jgi:preprotein translocase SecE subunit|nr:preprotein translocase subunit SecE [Tepidisphaeraceae bacterium]